MIRGTLGIPVAGLLFAAGAFAQNATPEALRDLARLQQQRDSLVAHRWETRRVQQLEREALQDSIDLVADDLEERRRRRFRLQEELDLRPPPLPAPTPDATWRAVLDQRLGILRGRIEQGLAWDLEMRLGRLDSLRQIVLSTPSDARAIDAALGAWTAEWVFAAGSELRTDMPLPWASGEKGHLIRIGLLGAWGASGETSGILWRGPAGWIWRDDLPVATATKLQGSLGHKTPNFLPLDPSGQRATGPGWFAGDTTPQPAAEIRGGWGDLRHGPLSDLPLWVARVLMVYLIWLGFLVVIRGHRRSRALARETAYAEGNDDQLCRLLTSGATSSQAPSPPDTLRGRLERIALERRDLVPDAFEQILAAEESAGARALERDLGFLGTVGSNAPFVGLLGTVAGILHAFAQLGIDGGGSEVVMAAIAEALVATAVGLAVAIPAIWIYNNLQLRLRHILDRTRELRTRLLAASIEASARGGA